MINSVVTIADILMGRSPDGEYEDERFVYTVKGKRVTMTSKPIKSPFIYSVDEGQDG